MYRKRGIVTKIKNSGNASKHEPPLSLTSRRPTFGATAEKEYLARNHARTEVQLQQGSHVDNNNDNDVVPDVYRTDNPRKRGAFISKVNRRGKKQPDTLTSRRPTFGATAEEEYAARNKACARFHKKKGDDNNVSDNVQLKTLNDVSAGLDLVNSEDDVLEVTMSEDDMSEVDMLEEVDMFKKRVSRISSSEKYVTVVQSMQHMEALCKIISTKANDTIHEINKFFIKFQETLRERRECLLQEVVTHQTKLEKDIRQEYELIEKNWMNKSNEHSQMNSECNVQSDLNLLSSDYFFLWNSAKMEDIMEEVDQTAVLKMVSMAPHKTKVEHGIGGIGYNYRLKVITFSPNGTHCVLGGMTFSACVFSNVQKRALHCDVIDNNDGTYEVRFLPCHAGAYTVSMCVGEESQHCMEVEVNVVRILVTSHPSFANVQSQVSFRLDDTNTSSELSSLSGCILSPSGVVLDTQCTLQQNSLSLSFVPLSKDTHTLLIRSSTGDVIGSYRLPIGTMLYKHIFANLESSITFEHVNIADMKVEMETVDGQDVPIVYMGGDIGIQTYKFIPEAKGILKLQVKDDDDLALCTNIHVGSLLVDVKGAVVNGTCTVIVNACDCSGFPLNDAIEDVQLTAQLSNLDGCTVNCDILLQTGSWQISYIPKSIGFYHMMLFLDGVVFRESPIQIEVNKHVEIFGGSSSEFFGIASDICTSVDGDTYIADTVENNRIVILDPDSRFHSSIPVKTRDVSLIAINYSGTKIYVLCIIKKIMEVYDIQTHKCLFSTSMDGIGAPSALILDRYDNTLLISDTEKKCIFVIDPENCKEDYRITPLDAPLKWPSDVCVDKKGILYVCDTDAGTVFVMNKRGAKVNKNVGSEDVLKDPVAVAIDDDNRLLVLLRTQQMCLYGNDCKLLGILKTRGSLSRRSKMQLMPDGYFIKNNEKENCLRKYHYGSIEKSTLEIRTSHRTSGRPRGRRFSSNGSLVVSSRSASSSPDSLSRLLLCLPFQFPGQDKKSRSCLDLSLLHNEE